MKLVATTSVSASPVIVKNERENGGGLFSIRRSDNGEPVDRKLINVGLLMAIGIAIHNLPEGIAVGAGYLHNPPQFGIFVAIAIMLHNIPEGIATALPPLCRGGICKRDAIKIAFLSGLAEPIGAVLASLVLINFTKLLPGALAFAAGGDGVYYLRRTHSHRARTRA